MELKTNFTLTSPDRELFGIKIRQQTKTKFLNLSDLAESYEVVRFREGLPEKRLDHILAQNENAERIYYILKEQSLINVRFDTFMEIVENQGGILKYLKTAGMYKTSGARQTKTTWCDPYIWQLAALELHPMIYAKTVIWQTDNLIMNRIEAGNMYKGLSAAVAKFTNVDFSQMAKALNYISFGRHETGIRNLGTQEQLFELQTLEMQMAWAIDMGFITSFEQFMEELRKMYHKKYPKVA